MYTNTFLYTYGLAITSQTRYQPAQESWRQQQRDDLMITGTAKDSKCAAQHRLHGGRKNHNPSRLSAYAALALVMDTQQIIYRLRR